MSDLALPVRNETMPSLAGHALRYARTLRHLRPVQVYGRLWHRLHTPHADTGPAPTLRARTGRWCEFLGRVPSMQGPDAFRLLNRSGEVRTASDWNAPEHDKLWLYNLHYFDDLNAQGRDARADWHRGALARWIAENPPGHGNGWEPYPLSLRIVNWIKWAAAGHRPDAAWLHSLAVQSRYLSGCIEWHLLGNHLFANAKALIFAGVLFEGAEAERWRTAGLRILERELPEQILPDGGHFERSPMYHALIQEDLLDLVNLTRAYPGALPGGAVEAWREALGRMRVWLAAMSHPDGEISFFNDAAFGIAAPPAALETYARDLDCGACASPSEGVTHLKESGYVRVQLGPQVAILDVAPVGPDYLPGHAHADTLSFELSVSGRRVIVNSGTSLYGDGPERQRQRGTAAHSTVEVDGEDSSEVWGGFRVARRARPFGLSIESAGGEVRVRCAHDGYRRLPGRVTHWREWRMTAERCRIADELEGTYRKAVGRLHLHPDVAATATASGAVLTAPAARGLVVSVSGGSATLTASAFHPQFGIARPGSALSVALAGPRCESVLDCRTAERA